MKKYLLGILAVIAMTSCVKDQLVHTGMSGAITFNAPFILNVTNRAAEDPSITTGSIDAFDVWGFMNGNGGIVFDQKRVVRTGTVEGSDKGIWSYSAPIMYWFPNRTYRFAALAPVDNSDIQFELAENGKMSNEGALGTVSFTNKDGQLDLLYAQPDAIVTGSQDELLANAPIVGLVFKHLLTKVKFSFRNGFQSEYNSMKVTNIRLKVPTTGSVDLTQTTHPYEWQVSSAYDALTLNFGDVVNVTDPSKGAHLGIGEVGVCEFERLTIPVKQSANAAPELIVEFDVELYQGEEVAIEKSTRTAKLVFDGSINKIESNGSVSKLTALEQGRGYRINALLSNENVAEDELLVIKFDGIRVGEWNDPNNPEEDKEIEL